MYLLILLTHYTYQKLNINKSLNGPKNGAKRFPVVTAAPTTAVFVRLLDVGICSSCDEVSNLDMDRLGEDRRSLIKENTHIKPYGIWRMEAQMPIIWIRDMKVCDLNMVQISSFNQE